ncbi:MAG: hypothetical protein AB7N80_11645 [Bdellovibrionales bacterium]
MFRYLAATLTTLFFSSQAFAYSPQALTLNYSDFELTSTTYLNLSEDLRRNYPDHLIGRQIAGVTVKAKSKYGNGEATLWIGNAQSRGYRIDGSDHFYNPADWTFQNVYIEAPSRGRHGQWQLGLSNHMIVRQVTVYFADDNHHHPRPPHSNYETLDCSYDNTCRPSGRIVRARLQYEYSTNECVLNRTWGVTRQYIWTAGYCSARFQVEVE